MKQRAIEMFESIISKLKNQDSLGAKQSIKIYQDCIEVLKLEIEGSRIVL